MCAHLHLRGGSVKKVTLILLSLLLLLVLLASCEKAPKTITGASPVVREYTVDQTACTGCGNCFNTCQYGAITVLGNKPVIDKSLCQRCGRCQSVCPSQAIR